MSTLLKILPMLLDVWLLCAFAYFVFGIVGIQIFSGALLYRHPSTSAVDAETTLAVQMWISMPK